MPRHRGRAPRPDLARTARWQFEGAAGLTSKTISKMKDEMKVSEAGHVKDVGGSESHDVIYGTELQAGADPRVFEVPASRGRPAPASSRPPPPHGAQRRSGMLQ